MLTEQEQELFNSDGKFRSYTSGIDKALKNFEYSSEWPDLISALGKLSKVIQSNTRFKAIPKSLVVSKRLGQCLHPSLPSGVHIKALEVYDLVFKCIHGQKDKIFTFSSGLFPLLSYAGMAVKPLILKIYEDHFLPLEHHLVDALDGLLPALLSGMEEGSDVYVRSTILLTSIKICVGSGIFYTKLWDSMTLSVCRLPAINYMLQENYVPEEPSQILPHLLDCLADVNILTQRSALELINTWTMDSWDSNVRVDIMAGAMGTLLRRDVSLNRRFYNMVIGENEAMDETLVRATRKILQIHQDKFRIIMMLFDKPEICAKIMDYILIDVIRTLHETQEKDSLSMLMCNLEPAYIITYLSNQDLNPEICKLISFIHKYIGGDFTPLLLKLIDPKVHKLELAIQILNGKPSCDIDLIRNKVITLYTRTAHCVDELFSDYQPKGFDFDDIITNVISEDHDEEAEGDDDEDDGEGEYVYGSRHEGETCNTIESCSTVNTNQVQIQQDSEPLTCYYSLSESLAIDSVDSCNYHFGLNDFNSNRCFIVDKDKTLVDSSDDSTTVQNSASDKMFQENDTTKADSLLREMNEEEEERRQSKQIEIGRDEKVVNFLCEHPQLQQQQVYPSTTSLNSIGKNHDTDNQVDDNRNNNTNDKNDNDCEILLLKDNECDNSLNCHSENLEESSSSTFKLNSSETENCSNIHGSLCIENETTPKQQQLHMKAASPQKFSKLSNNDSELLSVLHKTIPPVMKQPYDTISPWLRTLLSNCLSETSSAVESLLEILDNDIEIIPKQKLRKLQIVNNIVNHLWNTKSHRQLSRFLHHFPETESNIVIKLNNYSEILQFQDFITLHNTIVDSCILKLIDNLKSNDQLLSNCSYELLNRLVKSSVSIVLDPIIINLLDKSTRRHYIDVKSNSTPDLTKLHASNKVLNRSTGNLSTLDNPEVNIVVYNGMYDTRRIKFILEKLQSILCFQNFIVNTARVHVSDSIRWKLLSKLIQQQCGEVNGVTYIHVLIHCLVNFSTCLYSSGTIEDVNSNVDVQVTAIGVLNEYISRLIPLSTTNLLTHQSSSFTCYIDSVMKSTKLVKRILISLLSIVNLNNSMGEHANLLHFNYSDENYKCIVQYGLIKLLTALIQLESKVMPVSQHKPVDDVDVAKQENGKYIPGLPLPEQPLFKQLILQGLRNCTYHWEDLLRKSIVYFGNGLWSFVHGVVGVLCDNIMSRTSIEVNLETLTSMLHYIILDTDVDSSKSNQPTTESSIYSILTSWLPQSGSHSGSNGNNNVLGSNNELVPKHQAKVNLLAEFGGVLNTLGFVWVHESNLRNKVIQLLNPIALTHMDDFVSATSDIPTTDHLVDIILHLNVIRLANLTSSTITVITSAKNTTKCINMLQLYSHYIGSIGSSLSQDLPMPLLIQLIRESANLPPEAQNLLLLILNRVMCTFGLPPSINRQEVKELQECTQKLLEFVSSNASPVELNKKKNSSANIIECLYSLSNNLPGLLDIVWGSEDKDKLLPVLSHVIYLVFPHLKSKTSPTFEPATILFTNLTKFTHLKKAWKKEIFDHLIDASFFRMSLGDFKNWLIILDNVFSQDKGSFSELIARATVPTSNSLNIFTSKETEYENRAMLLKRLAVVIYSSSNMDEYVKFITSIQERISEALKASPTVIPNIQLSVFLLFRVLLVKLSVNHLTSLWPIIIHEVSVVLSLLEQDLISSMNNIITTDGRMEKPWNSVYNSVFKLLSEASKLPLFKMYSWNFTNNIIPRLKQHNNDLITAFETIEERGSLSIEEDFLEV